MSSNFGPIRSYMAKSRFTGATTGLLSLNEYKSLLLRLYQIISKLIDTGLLRIRINPFTKDTSTPVVFERIQDYRAFCLIYSLKIAIGLIPTQQFS